MIGGWVDEAFALKLLKVIPFWCGRHTNHPGQVYIALDEESVRKAVGCKCSISSGCGKKK